MAQSMETEAQEKRKRTISDSLLWLILIPLVLITLFCCGQLAALLLLPTPPANTRSLLAADYKPWAYDKIRSINVSAFMNDLQRDQSLEEAKLESTVVSSVFLQLPTAKPGSLSQIPTLTPTPEGQPPQPTQAGSITVSPTIDATGSAQTATTAATQRTTTAPSKTLTPQPTVVPPTATRTYAPLFTRTPTNSPPEPTDTRAPTFTLTPSKIPPSKTPVTPSATPITPTVTPETPTAEFSATPETPTVEPTITPTYAPVRPIAEGNGVSSVYNNPDGTVGCLIYFGYINDNPQPVVIPTGTRNTLSDPSVQATLPTTFKVGRQFAAFSVIWYTGKPLDWQLDSTTATAYWCIAP